MKLKNQTKGLLLILISLFLICSCNKEQKTKITKTEKIAKRYELEEELLDYEKVALYSIINNIDKEKVKAVIIDYNVKTDYNIDLNLDYIEKVIDTISINRNIDKKEVAKIIFGYKYEMVTKEEVLESTYEQIPDYDTDYDVEHNYR